MTTDPTYYFRYSGDLAFTGEYIIEGSSSILIRAGHKRMGLGYSNVRVSILGNFSYLMKHAKEVSDNGNIIKISAGRAKTLFKIQVEINETFINTSASTSMYAVVVTALQRNLKIVTCGYRGVEQLNFMELLSAFDKNVWFELATIIISLIVTFTNIPGHASKLKVIEAHLIPAKLLLEQGNRVSNSVIASHRCKWITRTTLLMAIVLSNAYNSTNVYNMIIPRKSLPNRYLPELVQGKFNIYTKSEHVCIANTRWSTQGNPHDAFRWCMQTVTADSTTCAWKRILK